MIAAGAAFGFFRGSTPLRNAPTKRMQLIAPVNCFLPVVKTRTTVRDHVENSRKAEFSSHDLHV